MSILLYSYKECVIEEFKLNLIFSVTFVNFNKNNNLYPV